MIPGRTLYRFSYAMALACLAAIPRGSEAQILSPGKLASAHSEIEGIRQCTTCHELGRRGISPERCLACHEVVAERIQADRGYHATVSGACADCHKDHLGTDFDLLRLDEATFDHGPTGYDLVLSHADVTCRDCHQPSRITEARIVSFKGERGALDRTFLGLAQSCTGCHQEESPHGDQFADRSCADCHDEGLWDEPPPFEHNSARFRLDGSHTTVDCAQCHGADPASVVYRPLAFGKCNDCHDDPHAGGMNGTCASCHDTRGWAFLATGDLGARFDHSRTAFPLLGAHASSECVECHRQGRPPSTEDIRMRYRPGTEGFSYPRPIANTCGSCHVDRHALPGSGNRWADCTTCHSEARFSPSSYDLARHVSQSTFALTGAHVATPCFACHQDPDQGHTQFTLGLPARTCLECHQADSPHEDLYADMTCETCHVTDAFDEVSFDHVLVTSDSDPRACSTCHAADDPHQDQFVDRDCATCHITEHFTIEAFDHAPTRFPLDGAHEGALCASCHVPEQGPTGLFVRYRPLGIECADCHGGTR